MPDIFLSYSSNDRERIKPLVAALEGQGWSVWWDRKIPPGKTWHQTIEEALNDAKCVVVAWTADSVKSDWVMIEAEEGKSRMALFPVFMDEVKPPLSFRLIQGVQLIGWQGETAHTEFHSLIASLQEAIGKPSVETATPARKDISTATPREKHVVEEQAGRTAPDAQLQPGAMLIDRYKILERVGRTSMGSVYLAEDQILGKRKVAIKELIPMFVDELAREKATDFRREAEVLGRLEHPSIPTIYQYFFDANSDYFYLVMRFIDGSDLSSRQQAAGGKVDEVIVTKWAIQICEVLDYLHTQDPPIINRDLKPRNLMIENRTNRMMLVDFGIAVFMPPAGAGVDPIGTMGYAPPELYAGKVEARSDIYSLGATMFQLLTGHDPTDNPLLIFDFNKKPTPRQINPEISENMEAMLKHALESRLEDRPSAKEFGERLKMHLLILEEGSQRQAPDLAPEPPE